MSSAFYGNTEILGHPGGSKETYVLEYLPKPRPLLFSKWQHGRARVAAGLAQHVHRLLDRYVAALAAYALAYQMTGDEKYARWHQMIHHWAHLHFHDLEFGEWFGYLHRDGRLSSRVKGNLWKGPFHLPRMQLRCWKILEQMRAGQITEGAKRA